MATSSFNHEVIIDSDKKAQALLDAIEKSKTFAENNPARKVNCETPKDLKSFLKSIKLK